MEPKVYEREWNFSKYTFSYSFDFSKHFIVHIQNKDGNGENPNPLKQ